MDRKTLFALISLVLVLGLALSALADPTPASKPTGELRIGVNDPGNWTIDPRASKMMEMAIINQVFDPLIGYTDDGKLSAEGGVAERWVTSADNRRITFYLRKGIKFHNGDEVTAADVKFSLDSLIQHGTSLYRGEYERGIESVEAPDRYTVIIHLKQPNATIFMYWLSGLVSPDFRILPKQYVEKVGDEYFAAHPIGSGPYKVAEIATGDHITLEAVDYPHFAKGVPKFKRVTFNFIVEEGTRVAMLKKEDLDIIELSRARCEEVKAAGFKLYQKEGQVNGTVIFVLWPTEKTKDMPLSNKKVREALVLAIPREEILNTLLGGYGFLTGTFALTPWALGWVDITPHKYNLQRAKELMVEAGYPDGFELTMVSTYAKEIPELQEIDEVIASVWATELKVKPKIEVMDWTTWSKRRKAGDFYGYYWSSFSSGRVYAGALIRVMMHSKAGNARADDPQLDARIGEMMAQTTEQGFAQAQEKTLRYIHDNFLGISLGVLTANFAVNPEKVKEWRQNNTPRDYNLAAIK